MAVEISSRLILYKCSEFIWPINTDSRYQKPINELGCADYTANVPDNVTVTDLARKVVAIGTKSETVGVVESYSRKVIYSPTITEKIIVGDQATPATLLQISNASAAPVKQIVVYGKSTQVQTTQGNNLCPPFKYWTLENGAYIDGDSVILPNENSVAYCDINWEYRSSFLGLGYESITSIAVENNPRTLFSIIYYDINYTQLGINGHTKNIINNTRSEEYFGNTNPQATSYSLAISQSYKIRIKILRDNTYATYPYGVKNIVIQDLVQNPTFLPYQAFVPNSPSPDYPSPISSVGDSGSVTIKRIGKNLLKYCVETSNTANRLFLDMNVFPNTTYTMFIENFNGILSGIYARRKIDGTYVAIKYLYNKNALTFTTEENDKVIGLQFYAPNKELKGSLYQLELSPTATSYEPYREQNITIPLSKPLLSVPNGAADKLYVDCVNKRCWVERNCEKYTFTGSENSWHQSLAAPSFRYVFTPNYAYDSYSGICNICNYRLRSGNSGLYALVGVNNVSGRYVGFINSDTVWPTLNDLKTYLANLYNNGNPAYVIYQLATPYTEEIPWSDSYSLNTNTGINNIFCTDKVNANISVAYEADTIAKTIVKAPFKESTRIEPSLGFELCKHIQDMFSLFDTFRLYVAKTTREQIHISETYWDNIFFTLHILESFIIADKASRAHSRRFSDSFVVSDRITKKIVLNKSELLDIFDEFKRIFTSTRTFFENAKITDKAFKEMTSEQKECAVLTEFLSKSILALKTENLSLNDNFKRSVDFIRNVSEGFITGDDLRKTFGLNKRESIEVLDAFIRACNSIIADIAIDSEELDINKFLNIVKTPQGYTPFQEFNVGDYEYKEALIRFIIEVAEAQSEPLIRDVEHNVDIEEVIDRGIEKITDTAAPTKVFFNKHYYTPPFVQVTLKGGSTADGAVYPNILSTDKKIGDRRYFEIELINSLGERTSGLISWTSTGY